LNKKLNIIILLLKYLIHMDTKVIHLDTIEELEDDWGQYVIIDMKKTQ